MRYLIVFLVLVFFFSCSNQEKVNQKTSGADSVVHQTLSQVLTDSSGTDTLFQILQTTWALSDSAFFMGFANYFTSTQEFYVSLHAKTDSAYNYAEAKLDSTIYEEDGVSRKRLGLQEGRSLFFLNGMDTILIFNRAHHIIAKTTLTHIEYFSDMISGEFVAVYKADRPVKMEGGPWYCMSAGIRPPFEPVFSSEEINDLDLNARIAKRLKSDLSKDWKMQHVRVMPSGSIFSTASVDTTSFLLETTEGKIRILKQVNNDYHFGQIVPVPVTVNDKPLILIAYYFPETDVEGYFLSAYNKGAYEPMHYNRLGVSLASQ